MRATWKVLFFSLLLFSMALPLLVYGVEHDGLGANSIDAFRSMSAGQQAAQVVAGLYVKPAYMLLAAFLIVLLWNQSARPMRALLWGLIAFQVGETFCAINFIAYRHQSLISEYLHSYGMVLAFGLLTYSLLEVLDLRFHLNRHQSTVRRAGIFTAFMTSILAFLPLTVSLSPTEYQTRLFGVSYAYARFGFYQWYEARLLPWLAFSCLTAAGLTILFQKDAPLSNAAKALFSAGVGALGFSFFRVALGALYADQLVWFEFWEELTELMMVVAVTFILWQYQPSMFKKFFAALRGVIGQGGAK